jgi:flagellar basal-body rod protein FlgG
MPSGEAGYTRDGALKRSPDGQIVTADGYPVAPGITIPSDARRHLTINAAGEVYAYFDDQVEPELLGQLTLTGFTNEKGLEAIGSNLFLETPASGPPLGRAGAPRGWARCARATLKKVRSMPVREVTELIKAQRGYELNAKVITAADQMLAATTQVR